MGQNSVALSPSVMIPLLGMGTWELRGKRCEKAVRLGLEIGYRHIDTAHLYENHTPIRDAMRDYPRDQLFLTSKCMPIDLESETVIESCDRALKELGVDYLDLFLLHYPDRTTKMHKWFEELEKLQEKGKIRAWGVSNFTIHHLKDMLKSGFHPAVNQVEFHPYLYQKELLDYCNKKQIHLIAFRSLGKGALVADPLVEQIAKKHEKSIAQVLLRWAIEKNIPVIPKATSKIHLEENFAIFDFHLGQDDTEILDRLKLQHRFCQAGWSDYDYTNGEK